MSNARLDRPAATGRALLAFSAVSAVAAVVLLAVAWWPTDTGDSEVLEATPATAAVAPVTIPPLPDPSSPDRSFGDVSVTPRPASSTTPPEIELSALADLLGVSGSAIPAVVEARVQPRSVTIDDIELWGPVRPVGLEPDGQLEVPDETEIGWYRYGSSPGRAGATVLAAHVTWNNTIGPFFMLRELDPGALIDVALEDGSQRTYEVIERTIYDKDELPRSRIWRTTGDESLVLITCGGSFNPDINRYRENIVVYAVPVDASGALDAR